MSDFLVKTQSLDQTAGKLSSVSRRVDSIADEARDIIVKTRSSISSRLIEYGKSNVIHASVSNCASDLRNLSKGISEAANIYEKYERKLMGVEDAKTDKKKETSFGFDDLLKDLLKSVGVLGMAYSAGDSIGKGITSGKWSDFAKGAKSAFDAFEKNHKIYKQLKRYSNLKPSNGKIVTSWAKKIFGLESYAKTKGFIPSKASNLSTRWYNNFQKAKKAEFDELGESSGIIGVAISGVINGICNYEEYKSGKISGERAVVETVVETGVDVAVSTALGIGLGAVASTVGAPAVAVAAGVVVINAGLNFAVESLTNGEYDSFTELASDKIIDFAEDVRDTAVNCFDKAIDGISAGWKKLFG